MCSHMGARGELRLRAKNNDQLWHKIYPWKWWSSALFDRLVGHIFNNIIQLFRRLLHIYNLPEIPIICQVWSSMFSHCHVSGGSAFWACPKGQLAVLVGELGCWGRESSQHRSNGEMDPMDKQTSKENRENNIFYRNDPSLTFSIASYSQLAGGPKEAYWSTAHL